MSHKREKAVRAAVWTARLALTCGLAVAAACGVRAALDGSSAEDGAFQLRAVHYSGDQHLDRQQTDHLIRTAFPGNVLAIDLDRVRSLIESEDWVESATVRRRLPDELYIIVTERKPVAAATIDGELQVVDAQGVVLAPYGPDFQDLDKPIVKGLRNVALENARQENALRMATYLRIIGELDAADPDYTRSISEIDVADPRHVAVVPAQEPVPVFLGDSDFARRYRTFLSRIELYRELKERHGTVESVDVTYDDKIIIHRPDAPAPAQAKLQEAS